MSRPGHEWLHRALPSGASTPAAGTDLDGQLRRVADEHAALRSDQLVADRSVRLLGAHAQLTLPPVIAPRSRVEGWAGAERSADQCCGGGRQGRSLHCRWTAGILGIDPERHVWRNGLTMPVQDGPVDKEKPPCRRLAGFVPLTEVATEARRHGGLCIPFGLVEVPEQVVAGQRGSGAEDDRHTGAGSHGLEGPYNCSSSETLASASKSGSSASPVELVAIRMVSH